MSGEKTAPLPEVLTAIPRERAEALARFEAWAESTIERINYAIERINNPGGQHVAKCDPWERMPISAMQEMRRDLLHLLGREP